MSQGKTIPSNEGVSLKGGFKGGHLSHLRSSVKFLRGDLDAAVKTLIATTEDTARRPFGDGQITEVIHSMGKTEKAFRLLPTPGR